MARVDKRHDLYKSKKSSQVHSDGTTQSDVSEEVMSYLNDNNISVPELKQRATCAYSYAGHYWKFITNLPIIKKMYEEEGRDVEDI